MKWHWVYNYNSDFKPHAIPDPLIDGVTTNLKLRGVEEVVIEEFENRTIRLSPPLSLELTFDHLHKIELQNLKIEIASVYVEDVLTSLEELPIRKEIGIDYFKLHCKFRCLCLTPELREEFISKLKELLPEANAIREAISLNDVFN